MTYLQYLSDLRRRWLYLVVGLVAGVAAGLLTAPGESDRPVRFQATHTLLVQGGAQGQGLNLEQVALLAEAGPVPDRVSERLEGEGEPDFVLLEGIPAPDVGSLRIRAVSPTRDGAARAADLGAEELIAELDTARRTNFDRQVESLQSELSRVEAQLATIDGQLAITDPDDPVLEGIETRRTETQEQISEIRNQLETLQATGPAEAPLRTLEAARGRRIAEDGIKLPADPAPRAVVLGLIGLLVGVAGAMTANRLDVRIRSKSDAETSFGVPLLAEIPPKPGGRKDTPEILSSPQPSTPFVEAYRALRTVILFAATSGSQDGVATNGHASARATGASHHADHEAQVVLITSPTAGEGKTTTAAYLGALLAETGKSVLIVSADFRRPRVHLLFGVAREPGLADVLTGRTDLSLSDLDIATQIPGVRLLPSGSPVTNPAPFLRETAQLIAAARQLVDFVVVDTAPLLVANDATELAGVADMVVLLARADRTTRQSARSAIEVLQRVDAPVLGSVLIAANDTPTAYRYYKYRYYSDADTHPEPSHGRRRSADKGERTRSPAAEPALTSEDAG